MEPEGSLPRLQEHPNCPYPEPDRYCPYPHPASWTFILILSSYLCLGLPSDLLATGLTTKTLYASLLSPIRATCYVHLSLVDFITRMMFDEKYREWSSLLCSLLHSPVTSSVLGPNILLSTLFSKTLSLHSSLSVSDQLSQPYKTTGNIIVLYILIFTIFDRKLEDKRFCTEW